MSSRRSIPLVPTPGELMALVVLGYFLWYISSSAISILIGVFGMAAAGLAWRALARWGPRTWNPSAIWLMAAFALAIALPFLADGRFRTTQLATLAYTAIIVLSLNLITGYTGQTSLGHAALVGVGAYTVAIMINEWQTNIVVAMLCATVFAALAGLIVGLPALRLSGHYLAIATLGLGVAFVPIIKLDELARYTGGFQGLSLFRYRFGPPVSLPWLTAERWYYFVAAASLGVALLLTANILRTSAGRAFRAVRDNEIAASAMGINVALTKLTAFCISAAYAGFAGGLLFIVSNRFVSVEGFTLVYMIELLVAMVVGGRASLVGSLLGAFFLVYLYREGIETFAMDTERGSDRWLLLAGTAIALAVLFGSAWAHRWTHRLAPRLSTRFGMLMVTVLKVVLALILGYVLAWLFRQGANHVIDISFLRGAITGSVLVAIVLFLPDGFAGLAHGIARLRWSDVRSWLRRSLVSAALEPETQDADMPEGAPLAPR